MFFPVPKGSCEIIPICGFDYKCQLPPVGYGKHRLTGEIKYVGVRSVSTSKNSQVWQPIKLPDNWNEKRKKEISRQKADEEYYDPDLEKVREKWWLHRLCGEWIMINGKATYIPPSFWFYLVCSPLDVGLPDYRDTDKMIYYVWEFCCEDPACGGLVDIERRRMGKTYKAGSIALDRTSIYANHHSSIQSKTSADAKQVFLKTVINFFKKIPDFFRPIYDQSKGVTPTSELKFFQTVVKGKRAEDILGGEELESWCDWVSSDIFALDGSKLGTYIDDEFGKTPDVDVWDRWNVVRFCLDQDGVWCGKALHTSTIEELESGGRAAKKLWDASNPNQKDDNGRTASGCYWFFLPAYMTIFFDKFGKPEIEKGRQYYLNQRAGLVNDLRALSSMKRKNPFTIDEAFAVDGDNCHYNPELLNTRIENLWQDNLTTRGNFVWENGVQDSRVIFEKSRTGRWEICWTFKDSADTNKVTRKGNTWAPANTLKFVMGCDPFSHNKTVDNRRSDGAGTVLMKFDANESEEHSKMFVCRYKARPESASIFYEDMLKTAVYYGCQILFENNKNNWDIYFKQRGYEAFLMKLDGYPDYGIPGNENTCRQLVEVTEEYINRHVEKVYFKDLCLQWLEFDMANTTKFDLAMAAGYTLIADLRKIYRRQEGNLKPLTDYVRKYKLN